MSRRSLKAAFAAAITASLALTAVPAHAAPDPDPLVWADLTGTYAATGVYQYEPFAVADGFKPTPCAEMPPDGGMGYHYFNLENIDKLTPSTPAALLYEDTPDQGRRLVGVEWIASADTHSSAPTMFGQTFRGPRAYTEPLNGSFYTLHAWIYKENPNGLFGLWNPTVKCS
ncbi:hypothetical protein AB0I00_07140 [Streptomyces sp. NPDC050803]|uniref:hypothetical protein n=1 Tax=unclassified Streptomyces TaxID=2593676 RepID=UPI00343687E9